MELLKHNQKAYEEIKENFRKYRKVLYVSGVGTGKSFVFLALAENVFKGRILYVITPPHKTLVELCSSWDINGTAAYRRPWFFRYLPVFTYFRL